MSFTYEAAVDEHLYEAFRLLAIPMLEGLGYHTGLHIANLQGPGVVELHRDDDIVTISATRETQHRRRLVISSETVEVAPLVAMVVEHLVTVMVASFWAPAMGADTEAVSQEVEQALSTVWQHFYRDSSDPDSPRNS